MIWKLRIALKQTFVKLFAKRTKLFHDIIYTKIIFLITFGRFPNIKAPKTFNENIFCLKNREIEYDYAKYTDKYEVREYVEQKIGKQYLNEVLGIYNSFDEIDFGKLPNEFALKATHGSSYNVIVTDKKLLDIEKTKTKFDKWLKENFFYKAREKNYFNIKPRIMCDHFLKPETGVLEEFKLFCFYGKVKFIQYNKETAQGRFDNLYDANWNKIDVIYGYPNFEGAVLPNNKNELISVAEKLAEPFVFVRADLYNIDGKIIFSELTFHSGGGMVPFKPKKYDQIFGKFFEKEDTKS